MRRPSLRPARPSSWAVALVVALCLALVVPTSAVALAGDGASSARAGDGNRLIVPKFRRAPQHYNPPQGLKTNNPLGSKARKREINRHLLALINSVPGSESIRMASWNIRSKSFVDALIRAHRRGVSVRVVVARGNARPSNPNRDVDRLQYALAHNGNLKRKRGYRSKLRRCTSACRGPRGIAHTKFYLFSRVGGGARHVVVNGSANATDTATVAQWNDVYTTKNRKGVYATFNRVYSQMIKDRNVAKPYVSVKHGEITAFFNPYHGSGDPVLRRLNATRCKGVTHGAGVGGRTKIRIAMTSFHGGRGKRLAHRVKQLYNQGCNVRIIYAVMGNEILRIMRRGGRGAVPMRQIAKANNQGVYVRYLHMKVLTISGVHRGRRDARVTYNGSENWSPAALPSDEAGMQIYSARLVGAYNSWIDYLFAHPPYRQGRAARAGRTARGTGAEDLAVSEMPPVAVEEYAEERGIDPYARMQVD